MRLLLSLLLVVAALIACRPPEDKEQTSGTVSSNGLQTRVELEGEPKLGTVPVSVFILKDGEGVSGATVGITGDMTHAGMVPVIADANETEAGLYRTNDFTFTMAGDWILTTDIELADGTKETLETRVTVPGE